MRVWHEQVARERGRLRKSLKALKRKLSNRRFVRFALLGGNVAVLGLISVFVFNGTGTNTVERSAPNQTNAVADMNAASPLDQPSSADIAVNLARMTSLPETSAVSNQADSAKIELSFSAAGDVVASKPQAVATALKSKKDIKKYVVAAGDSVPSVAAKFNVTSDSIRWSNSITGDALSIGASLWIPPVTGIVYTVASGDTPDSLAQKYKITREQIIAHNDAEINGLKVGEQIILPEAQQPAPPRAVPSYGGGYVSSGFAFGSTAVYGGNGYIPGWCTFYVANRVSIPNNWGNANTWDNGARATSGWTVSSIPVKGAVAQTDRGSQGHVAYVEEVSADGSQIIYSDMNGIAGFNRVGKSDWVSSSYFQNYIYR